MIQLGPLNNRIKTIFLDLSEGMENCKLSGKSQGILRWMISVIPCLLLCSHDYELSGACNVGHYMCFMDN